MKITIRQLNLTLKEPNWVYDTRDCCTWVIDQSLNIFFEIDSITNQEWRLRCGSQPLGTYKTCDYAQGVAWGLYLKFIRNIFVDVNIGDTNE